jgi:hypothetical protein
MQGKTETPVGSIGEKSWLKAMELEIYRGKSKTKIMQNLLLVLRKILYFI